MFSLHNLEVQKADASYNLKSKLTKKEQHVSHVKQLIIWLTFIQCHKKKADLVIIFSTIVVYYLNLHEQQNITTVSQMNANHINLQVWWSLEPPDCTEKSTNLKYKHYTSQPERIMEQKKKHGKTNTWKHNPFLKHIEVPSFFFPTF